MKIDLFLPKFKLYDFDDRRSGALARLIFTVANIPYEDIIINHEEQWDALKNETPLGTLPILEIDGMKMNGQTAICRHLAWRFGLSGQSAASDFLLDMFADMLFEAQILFSGTMTDVTERRTNCLTTDNMELVEIVQRTLSVIEKQLNTNNSSYIIGEEITWVDLMIYTFFNTIMEQGKDIILDRYPLTKKMYQRILHTLQLLQKSQNS
ncbi:unnamed protein product [Thelazia callipaeda]|uniref:Glutathione S-transferase n=1 Tax=Thelazia callipaeda TaxID=103827 RepID=A0A0N5D9A5_THECL|nr:unnamed protein product [Thelazia callipaeda]